MADGRYLVLARKYRPQTFEDVVGQEHVTRTLQNAIRAERVGHAFLFIGSRGIGKTTSARILAKALNCMNADGPTPDPCGTCDNCESIARGSNIDVIEIDGASNNSVEDVRQIRENIRMVPSQSRYKIYVIDEVHQLSIPAFNALLKTLEEPPPHAIFILATTEAHKIPATIISRCQRYDFRRVAIVDIVGLLRRIVESEGVACSDEALHAIARAADGGIRDSESILDQLMSYCGKEITFKDVFDVLGLVDWEVMHALCDALNKKDVATLLRLVEDVAVSGKDLGQFVEEIVRYYRNLLICRSGAPRELLGLPPDEVTVMEQWAETYSLTELIRLVEQFAELAGNFETQLAQRTALESLLIKMCKRSVEVSVDTVLEKLMRLADGQPLPATPPESAAPPPSPAPAKASKKKVADPPPPPVAEDVPATPDAPPPPAPEPEPVAENAEAVWRALVDMLNEAGNMQSVVWLGQATRQRLDDGVLVIGFPKDKATGAAYVDDAANKRDMLELLQPRAPFVRAIKTEVDRETPAPKSASKSASDPAGAAINPEDERAVKEDPYVSKILDVFRGQVVDIKRKPGAAPIPPQAGE